MAGKKVILMLCTGDTCRGPMASGYLRKLMEDAGVKGVEVRSAGVLTVNSLLATPESVQMLEAHGVDLVRHRSKPMSGDLLRRCHLVLGMTPLHVQKAMAMAPEIKEIIHLLKEYSSGDTKKVQIDDPMGNTLEVYKKVFKEIRVACDRLAKMPFVTGKKAEPASKASRPPKKKKAAPAPAPVPVPAPAPAPSAKKAPAVKPSKKAEEKSAPKAAKKSAPPAKKASAKPAASQKAPAKPVASKKAPAKKAPAKKAVAKKPVAKKPAAQKPVVKKAVTKKPAAKKPAAKQAPAKKAVAKKPAAKKAVAKKTVAKKTKKTARKK